MTADSFQRSRCAGMCNFLIFEAVGMAFFALLCFALLDRAV
jgi:hypothetical protein